MVPYLLFVQHLQGMTVKKLFLQPPAKNVQVQLPGELIDKIETHYIILNTAQMNFA